MFVYQKLECLNLEQSQTGPDREDFSDSYIKVFQIPNKSVDNRNGEYKYKMNRSN